MYQLRKYTYYEMKVLWAQNGYHTPHSLILTCFSGVHVCLAGKSLDYDVGSPSSKLDLHLYFPFGDFFFPTSLFLVSMFGWGFFEINIIPFYFKQTFSFQILLYIFPQEDEKMAEITWNQSQILSWISVVGFSTE